MKSKKRTKAIVTGGLGFIGSHLVDFLSKKGIETVIIDNATQKKQIPRENVTVIHEDIRDAKKMHDIFMAAGAQYVFHLAAITSVSYAATHPLVTKQTNIEGTRNVLQACVDSHVEKIIFASSAAVYGDAKHLPISEDDQKNPLNLYGQSKLEGEKMILHYYKTHGLRYAILRFANVYGLGQKVDLEGGVLSIFCSRILSQRPCTIYGDGTQTRDFIYVDDVVHAVMSAAKSKENFIANISTEKETSINELIALCNHYAHKNAVVTMRSKRAGDITRSYLRNALARQYLHWKPRVSIQEGIEKLILDKR